MRAQDIMQRLNRHAVASAENHQQIFIEDWRDSDGRCYRVEYRCQPDGSQANAWVLSNPWGTNPYSYEHSHLATDGLLCIGGQTTREHSHYQLDFVVRRTRFWCTGYSYLREHGYTQTKRDIPEW